MRKLEILNFEIYKSHLTYRSHVWILALIDCEIENKSGFEG